MIVLHEYKVIYFEIPKVACSSLRYICAELLYPNRDKTVSVHKLKFPSIPTQRLGQYSNYFKFCFVRNPWGRLVSLYRDKILNEANGNDTFFTMRPGVANCLAEFEGFKAGMSFESFTQAIDSISDAKANRHFRSQYTFVIDQVGNLVVDFIGRFENLQEDYKKMCKMVGLPEMAIPHLKGSGSKDYYRFYNEETKQIVAKRYKKDIEIFGYSFD